MEIPQDRPLDARSGQEAVGKGQTGVAAAVFARRALSLFGPAFLSRFGEALRSLALPDEKRLVAEIEKTRELLERRIRK